MKKKLTKRALSLVLAIVLMMAIAVPASAATYTWTSGGYTYVATVNEGSTLYKYRLMPNTTANHMGATVTTLYLSSGASITINAPTSEFNSTYRSNLITALKRTPSLNSTRVVSSSESIYRYVYEDQATGDYGIYAKITCKTAPWNVTRNSSQILDSGTLSYAPTSTWTFEARMN